MRPTDRPAPRIGYLPYVEASVEKAYAVRMRELLSTFGSVVPYDGSARALFGAAFARTRRLACLVVNWTDNDLLDRTSREVALRKVVKLFARTIAMRLVARRLVFVRHNNHPHATAAGREADAERWVGRYERLFDAVVTHSGDERQRPRRYCPHPLYRRVASLPERTALDPLPAHYYVVFGRIVRYKRLEALIDAFPAGATLLVAGAIGDRAYADELATRERPNVLFRPGLLSEADAQAIVARSAALVISHADADVIVSASFFFAMTMRVPVIAVATPFLRWIAPRVGPGLLRVEPDVEALCRSIGVEPVAPRDDEAARIVEREFGDAVVIEALRGALALERV